MIRLAGFPYFGALRWYAENRALYDFEPDAALDPKPVFRYATRLRTSPIVWARFKSLVSKERNTGNVPR